MIVIITHNSLEYAFCDIFPGKKQSIKRKFELIIQVIIYSSDRESDYCLDCGIHF